MTVTLSVSEARAIHAAAQREVLAARWQVVQRAVEVESVPGGLARLREGTHALQVAEAACTRALVAIAVAQVQAQRAGMGMPLGATLGGCHAE